VGAQKNIKKIQNFYFYKVEEDIPPWTYKSREVKLFFNLIKSSNSSEMFIDSFSKLNKELFNEICSDDSKGGCNVKLFWNPLVKESLITQVDL
jgi:hypothetical protein